MYIEVGGTVLTVTFVMALVFGAVGNRTSFCTMGAVSDWVNMGDTGRLRAWLMAIAVALAGALALELTGVVDLNTSRIPYRSASFAWPRYLLGGALFGIGMTLASGCGSKNLIRVGGGNLKSVLVVLVMGLFAYLMTRTDFYGLVFLSWIGPLTPDLGQFGMASQELAQIAGGLAGSDSSDALRAPLGIAIVVGLLFFTLRSKDFRSSADNLLGGIVIGALVAGAWYLTGGPIGEAWAEAAEFADRPPEGVGVQSFTFVNPAADLLALVQAGGRAAYVTFGVAALAGVIVGSLLYALVSRRFRIEWFASWGDAARHLIGAALMGIGGVLGLGCTIGQGISGLSTMALGSVLVMAAIVLSSALTMKVQYYKMLYEDASVLDALVASLADLHLLPNGLRKLEAL